MRIGDASLICSRARSRVELFAIFVCLSTLLEQPLLLTQHVDDQVDFFPDRVPPVKPVFIVAKVAQGRNLVHVAFELNHRRRRAILDDELDRRERLEDTAPLGGWGLQLRVKELSDPIDVLAENLRVLLA